LPPEVQYGFLPPEDETGRGQGYFAYTIQAKGDLPTGTEIRNVATIVFDFGEVIDTNQIDPHDPSKGTDPEKEALVTIDAEAPSSMVTALPAESPASFTVSWTGDDGNGSGADRYTVYSRAGNAPFEPWLTNTTDTSAPFQGTDGVTYHFYVVATDGAGNEEPPKAVAEATTTVSDEGGAGLDYAAWLETHFTPEEIAEGLLTTRDADPDGDGLTNGQEFGFVTHPREANGATWRTTQAPGWIYLDYWRRTTRLQYTLEGSSDLLDWTPMDGLPQEVLETAGDAEHVRVSIPTVGGKVSRFVRVSAQE
jgi:hypothetical protein